MADKRCPTCFTLELELAKIRDITRDLFEEQIDYSLANAQKKPEEVYPFVKYVLTEVANRKKRKAEEGEVPTQMDMFSDKI